MKISALKPGMTVWDVARQRMGNTTMSTVVVWPVKIVSVSADAPLPFVIASWNGNAAKSYGARQVARWRRNEPLVIRSPMGRARLASKEEIAAHRSAPQREPKP